MAEKEIKVVALCQIHEALEERQKPDRRTQSNGMPTEVNQDRRKQSRRSRSAAKPEI